MISKEMETRIDQFIADNDKEPSWDGFIYVYKGKHHCNENFTGK